MKGNTETAREAAIEMCDDNMDEVRRELVSEGAYHTVVEGGYHSQALTDEEADFLTELLIDNGVNGLLSYVHTDSIDKDQRNIAVITPLVSTSGNTMEEVIHRLDDGNNYPGFFLDYNKDAQTFILCENSD